MIVLIVHDNAALLQGLDERLSYEGFRVIVRTPVQAVLETLYKENPRILLLQWPCGALTQKELNQWCEEQSSPFRLRKIEGDEEDALFETVMAFSQEILSETRL